MKINKTSINENGFCEFMKAIQFTFNKQFLKKQTNKKEQIN